MTDTIVTNIAAGVMTLRFNRPDKKNAITHVMYSACAEALRAADKDPAVRAVVITGNGDSFTAGNDLKEFLEDPPVTPDAPVFKFMEALSRLRKPAFAAVNGTAIGIGVTLLLHCDFVYAAPGVRFQLPFVSLALVPEFGSSLLLARYVGARRASELLLGGEPLTSENALADGLITGIIAADRLVAEVTQKAQAMAAKAPGAVRATKGLIRTDLNEITARMKLEDQAFAQRLATPELKEAIQAFYEKRHPDYSKFE